MAPTGTVYLTDGFERLDAPGRETTFYLDDEFVVRGTECRWVWTNSEPATIAGAEIYVPSKSQTWVFSVGDLDCAPVVVRFGGEVVFSPNVWFEHNNIKEQA